MRPIILLIPIGALIAYLLLQPRRRVVTTETTQQSFFPVFDFTPPTLSQPTPDKSLGTDKPLPPVGKMPITPPMPDYLINSQPEIFTPQTQASGSTPPMSNAPQNAVSISANGMQFIQSQEGFRANAYNDPPGSNTWSIGYGHQITGSDGLSRSSTVTQAQAQQIFANDVGAVASAIARAVSAPLTQGQFDAVTSLAYNIGLAAFAGSTLLRLLNSGNYSGASQEFLRWIYGDGRVLPALQARRQAEQAMFNGAYV